MSIILQDLKEYDYFTRGKNDVWVKTSWCESPTVCLKNVKTGEIEDFGIGGLTSESFTPLKFIKIRGRE